MTDVPEVGPVLLAGRVGHAVVEAIVALNPGASVDDRGSYLRVRAPGPCVVTRAAIEAELGSRFALPTDLERVMPSFRGRLAFGDEEVRWE